MERYCTKCGKPAAKQNDSLYLCEAGHENWINPAAAVGVYVIRDGAALFGVRSSEPGKGMLDVPGGFIEVGESAEQAAIRETREEFGIDIVIKSCFGTYTCTYQGRPALNIIFIAAMPAAQGVVPADDMGGGEPEWRSMSSLPGDGEVMEWMLPVHKDLQVWWQQNG